MKRLLSAFTEAPFDLLIVGGGITGAGIALDAALRGLRIGLIDKGDFASGTSSVSSKLVHGGLRYLEHGDIALVYQALRERRLLLENAPHLVHSLRFLIPFYRGSRIPPWKWRLGLTLYDFLAGRGNLRRSRSVSGADLERHFPGLQTDRLDGGAFYYDAQMDDARLCIDVLRSAAIRGAVVANYVEAVGFDRHGGRISAARVRDRLTGDELRIQARQVVNATGPWIDRVGRLADEAPRPLLSPTKGVHLMAANRLGLRDAVLLLHPADGRVFFVIPWPASPLSHPVSRSAHVLIGTTDTFASGEPDQLSVTPADSAYLLAGYNRYFQPALAEADIQGSFVGVRPLVRNRPGQPSALSREFRLSESPSGLLSAAGGKFTTFRHMAEVVTDRVVHNLGRPSRCRTRHFHLDGAPAEPWTTFVERSTNALCADYGLARESAWHLLGRYGRRALDVASALEQAPELAKPVMPGEPELMAEWLYQREHEMALFRADHLLRRTRLGLYHPELLQDTGLGAGAFRSPALTSPSCD